MQPNVIVCNLVQKMTLLGGLKALILGEVRAVLSGCSSED